MTRAIGFRAAFVLVLAACGGEEELTGPRDETKAACSAWIEGPVTESAPCLGSTDEELAPMLANARARCATMVDNLSNECIEPALEAFEQCLAEYEPTSCDELCPDGECHGSCPVECSDQRTMGMRIARAERD